VKFNKTYTLTITQSGEPDIVISYPLTIDFNIQRSLKGSAGAAQFRVMNLKPDTRDRLRQDKTEFTFDRVATLKAGYGDNLKTVAVGQIREANSVRNGTDYVTTIDTVDGGFGFSNGRIDVTYSKNTEKNEIIDGLIKSLSKQGIEKGVVSTFEGQISRAQVLSGSPTDILKDIAIQEGANFYIDNNRVFFLKSDEVIGTQNTVIEFKSSTGLLGTPRREGQYIRIDVLFENSVHVGQVISLQSTTTPLFNGQYRVHEVYHSGTISGSESSKVITTVGMLKGTFKNIGGN